MATREQLRSVATLVKEALLEQTNERFNLVPELTAKINAIFGDKLFADELEELQRSIVVLFMHGGTKEGRQKRASIEQLDSAIAVLDDPALMALLNTRPSKMWTELIIEKMTGRMLDLENIPTPTYARK
ncbi:hypothetical protein KBD71_04830 [Candidatus Woesebacteria bacterium]|nr:hypothetical protein [Candidatus Woesebacteria bacterium]